MALVSPSTALQGLAAVATSLALSFAASAGRPSDDEARMISAVAYSPDGSLLAIDVESLLYVWDTETGKLLFGVNYSPHQQVWSSNQKTEFSRDGNRITVTSYEAGAMILDSHTADVLAILTPYSTDIAFGPGSDVVVAFDNNMFRDDPTLYLHDTSDGKRIGQFQCSIAEKIQGLRSTAFSMDGTMVAAGGSYRRDDGSSAEFVAVWDANTGDERFVWTGPPLTTDKIAFSPDGALLLVHAIAPNDPVVSIVNTGDPARSFELLSQCSNILDVSFLSGRDTAVAVCESGNIQVCELTGGDCTLTAIEPIYRPEALAAHPDGRHIAVATGFGRVVVMNLDTGQRIEEFRIPREARDLDLESKPKGILDMLREAEDIPESEN